MAWIDRLENGDWSNNRRVVACNDTPDAVGSVSVKGGTDGTGSYIRLQMERGKRGLSFPLLRGRRMTGSQRRGGSTPARIWSRQIRRADTVVLAATLTAAMALEAAHFARVHLPDERR
jgi:hypothetical protein